MKEFCNYIQNTENELEKKKTKIFNFSSENAMCIANLSILTGRLITSFLMNAQLDKKTKYILGLSILMNKVYLFILT